MSNGRYRAYPEYKDSGLPWMTQVPVHWTEARFKHVLADKKKVLRPDLPAGSISFGRVVYKDAEIFSEDTKASYQEVLAGEFLVNPLNLNYDLLSLRTALSSIDVVVSTGYIVLQGTGRLHPNYARWLLQQFDVAHMKTLGAGVRQTINYADIGNSYFFEPPLPEQIQIAKFLDHETAKIDRLIEKQEELIRLLKEKRQAVISHAVTKGLNPHAPLKDSGIPWLGQVPAHWVCAKTSRYFKISMGQTILAEELIDDGAWPVFSATDGDHYFGRVNNPRVRLDVGDLVIPARGNSIGAVKLVREPSTTTQTTIYCKNLSRGILLAEFVYHFLRGHKANLFYFTQTAIPQITVEEVGSNPILIPPEAEQSDIANFLAGESAKFDTLMGEALDMITLLQERRTALISAAVTGKIDVRHWQPPVSVSAMETPTGAHA